MRVRALVVIFFILTKEAIYVGTSPLMQEFGNSRTGKTTATGLVNFLEHVLQAETDLARIHNIIRNNTDTKQSFTPEQEFDPLNKFSSYKETKSPTYNSKRQYFNNFYSGRTGEKMNNADLVRLFSQDYTTQDGQTVDFKNQNFGDLEEGRKFSSMEFDNDRLHERDKTYPDLDKSSPSSEIQSQTDNEERGDLKEAEEDVLYPGLKLKSETNPEKSFESSEIGHRDQDMPEENQNDYGKVDELQGNNDNSVQMDTRIKDQDFQKLKTNFSKPYNEQLFEFQNKDTRNMNTLEDTKSISKNSPLLLQEYDSEQPNELNIEKRQRRSTVKKSGAIYDENDENDDDLSENSAAEDEADMLTDDDSKLTDGRSSFMLRTGSDSIVSPTLTVPYYKSSNILQKLRQQDKSSSSIENSKVNNIHKRESRNGRKLQSLSEFSQKGTGKSNDDSSNNQPGRDDPLKYENDKSTGAINRPALNVMPSDLQSKIRKLLNRHNASLSSNYQTSGDPENIKEQQKFGHTRFRKRKDDTYPTLPHIRQDYDDYAPIRKSHNKDSSTCTGDGKGCFPNKTNTFSNQRDRLLTTPKRAEASHKTPTISGGESSGESDTEDAFQGRLPNTILDSILRKVNVTKNLSYHFGNALSKSDYGYSPRHWAGSSESSKTEEKDSYITIDNALQKIYHILEMLINHEINKKSCASLQPDLRSFLLWLLNMGEVAKNGREPSRQQSYSFNGQNERIHTSRLESEINEACASPEEIRRKISLLKKLIQEYNHLTETEKIKVQSVYKYLKEQINKLTTLLKSPQSDGKQENSKNKKSKYLSSQGYSYMNQLPPALAEVPIPAAPSDKYPFPSPDKTMPQLSLHDTNLGTDSAHSNQQFVPHLSLQDTNLAKDSVDTNQQFVPQLSLQDTNLATDSVDTNQQFVPQFSLQDTNLATESVVLNQQFVPELSLHETNLGTGSVVSNQQLVDKQLNSLGLNPEDENLPQQDVLNSNVGVLPLNASSAQSGAIENIVPQSGS